jgi:spore coat polysaccharide biosynthesis protein SpsF
MTAVFLQVRISSQRLPQKALAELSGRPVIEHAMQALKRVPAERHVILTDAESESALAPYVSRNGFSLFVGDPEDVLARFAAAAEWYAAETVLRATGDNPLVSARIAQRALEVHREGDADYTALTGAPLGTGVEVVRSGALLEAAEEATESYEREHVTPFIYRRPDRFKLVIREVSTAWLLPTARVTLDTKQDYEALQCIFDALYAGSPIDIETLVSHLAQQERRSRRNSA